MNNKPPSSEKDAPEDFWDLGDDDLEVNLPATGEEQPTQPPVEATKLQASPIESTAAEAQPLPSQQPFPSAAPADDSIGLSPNRSKWLTEFSIIEKVSLLVLLACLAGAAVWGISSYFKEAPQGELITFDEDFPAQGDKITLEAVDTWWRMPVRQGDNPDRGVILGANLIPCARLKLQDAGSATLQVTFRNGKFDLVGDPITLEVADGKFIQTGSDEITINSTNGFSSTSDLNAYTTGDVDPWSVVIEESGASTEKDEPFLRVRMKAIYKEN